MADQDLIAFKLFYSALHPSLLQFARHLLPTVEDAQEVVNDVFIKMWNNRLNLGPFDADAPKRLRSYAFRAVKNASLNKLRDQRKQYMELDEEIQDPTGVEQQLLGKELQQQMQILLQYLPERCRQVFMMSRIDQLPNKEIAELLDISVKTVENQMTKALKFFRKNLNYE